MARVDITLNGRVYTVACEDGQEPRLLEIARYLDAKLREVARGSGAAAAGEAQLLAMAALVVTDQLFDLKAEYDALAEGQLNGAEGQLNGAEGRLPAGGSADTAVAAAVDGIARRIEDIAARLERA
ncbi:cell division protein ZapA [Arenibaculum sp.]|jgi:cell division protein ZapA|uniref:cell division protein ZapA n=1 Tax=Arenibaculum sp. TaxID=2865862 RepID=UPI002E128941|nr:cell division protein ZapA [Arenibaculum sp.]